MADQTSFPVGISPEGCIDNKNILAGSSVV